MYLLAHNKESTCSYLAAEVMFLRSHRDAGGHSHVLRSHLETACLECCHLPRPQLGKYYPNEIKRIAFLKEQTSVQGSAVEKQFCCLKKDGLGCKRKLRERMTGAGPWPERKAKFAWAVAGGGCRGKRKQQEHPGPSFPAQLLPARFPGAVSACSLLSTALTVLLCATE